MADPSRSNAPRPREISSIQYLRGIAAVMVVWHHATNQVPGVAEYFPGQFGTSGVDLFFVISGFIMVVTTSGDMRPVDFWRRRIVRVVPLYWLLTLAMVAVALAMPSLFKTLKVAPVTLVQSLLFIPHYSQAFDDRIWPLLVPGWTLNYEMFFYAVFGATLYLPRERRLTLLTTGFVFLVLIGYAFGPFASAAAQTYTSPMLLEFLAGAWIALAWQRGRLQPSAALSLILIVSGFIFLAFRDQPLLGPLTQLLGATMVMAGALCPSFSRFKSRTLHAIGDSSYSLYLTHIFTLGLLRVIWTRIFPEGNGFVQACLFLLVALSACAVVGWLVFQALELPVLARLNRKRAQPASPVRKVAP